MPHQVESRLDFYGGRQPSEAPAYFLGDAAHYLCLPVTTIRSWVEGRPYTVKGRIVQSMPLVVPADRDNLHLSFLHLVEFHVVSSLRRVRGVQPRPVRRAINFLRKKFNSPHP